MAGWLPGLLTLAVWCALLGRAPALLVVAAIIVTGPLVAGVAVPEWRPGSAVILWAAFVLSCAWIVLILHIGQAVSGLA